MKVESVTAMPPLSTGVPTARGAGPADFAAAMDAATAGDAADERIVAARDVIRAFDVTLPADPSTAAIYADGARQVSIAQGLPEGICDFTRITPRQMLIVGGAMIAGGTVRAPSIAGALDLARTDPASDTPVNFFAYLRHQAMENEKTPGGMAVAVPQRTSIAAMKRAQNEWGVPVTYDDNYPGAPHVATPEEASAKLKAAIEAYRKEASLTPAQRIRRDVLKDMKVNEEGLAAMPPAERAAAETRIGEEVARRLRLHGLTGSEGKPGPDPADVAAIAATRTEPSEDRARRAA